MPTNTLHAAETYLDDAPLAARYVAIRASEAAALLNELSGLWKPRMDGVLRAEIYGHSILWDLGGNRLHAFHTNYEVLPKGADDIVLCDTLQQVLAYVLAKNW